MGTDVRAPASGSARLSLRLADVVAVVAVLSVVVGVIDALGWAAAGVRDLTTMALTACALAGVVLGGAWAIRTRAPGEHWRALLLVVGPLLVVAAHPPVAGIPAAALALLLRRAVRHGLT